MTVSRDRDPGSGNYSWSLVSREEVGIAEKEKFSGNGGGGRVGVGGMGLHRQGWECQAGLALSRCERDLRESSRAWD